MRALAILTVRDEGAYLLEWLAHHRAVGFTDFLVFSNDCSDGTDALLDRLDTLRVLAHVRNDGDHPQGPQWTALNRAAKHPLWAAADWVLVADIDEFVNIHAGDGTLADLFAALPKATAIPLTWRMFGNGGVVGFDDRPVTETFLRAAPPTLHWPWRAGLFKTLFRNDGTYAKPGVHRPRAPDPARLADQRWFDGSGRALPHSFARAGIFTDYRQDCGQIVQLNHYALGSMEGYILKCARGRANREAAGLDMGYWVERNFDAVEDRSILRHAPRRAAVQAGFMADPVLGPLHAAAVAWRHARFAELMREEAWRALFGRLLMTPASRVLTAAEAALIRRHAPS